MPFSNLFRANNKLLLNSHILNRTDEANFIAFSHVISSEEKEGAIE